MSTCASASAWRTCLPLASPLVLFSHASFTRLAELGVLDAEFARRIARAAGLRNRLVHEYEDIDPRRSSMRSSPHSKTSPSTFVAWTSS